MTQDSSAAENDRIHGYLVSQAERNDLSALWPRVMADRTTFLLALDRVSDAQAQWRLSEGDWTILEVARHMLFWGRSVTDIVEALAAGHGVDVPELGDLGPRVANLTEARAALTAEAIRFATLPERLPDEPNLDAEAAHPMFGALNHRAWFLFARLHDGDHTRQVEMIKASDDYPTG